MDGLPWFTEARSCGFDRARLYMLSLRRHWRNVVLACSGLFLRSRLRR